MYKYSFEGIAWIPSYGDTDCFQTDIIANSEEEAESKLKTKYRFMKGWALVETEEVK